MKNIFIHEVGMRDGLQMEKSVVPKEKKLEWIDQLVNANVDIIQIGSFVNPQRMPQMADTDELFLEINQKYANTKHPIFSGLVLNEKGLERAINSGVELICMGVSASETHSQKNTGMITSEALQRILSMAQQAKSAGFAVQVSVQSAFGCGFEGRVPKERVLSIIDKYLENGLFKISLADTAGHAYPQQVEDLFGEIKKRSDKTELTCHFHNTYGLGMANIYVAMQMDVEYFETAFGGLGGCPFTKIASGNVSTEDFLHYLHRLNLRKDIVISQIVDLAKQVSEFFGETLPGCVYQAGTLNY